MEKQRRMEIQKDRKTLDIEKFERAKKADTTKQDKQR